MRRITILVSLDRNIFAELIDLREIGEKFAWDEALKPEGYGDFHLESFEAWWARNHSKLRHLPEALAEQWIYRHWENSVSSFIPLEELQCREEVWPPIDFIERVGTVRGNEPLDPEYDFEMFSGQKTGEKLLTAQSLDQGQWDYPLVVLETPEGFIDCIGDHIKKQYFLVEGHKRRRYLNSLLMRGESLEDQKLFVLNCPSML